MEWERKFYDIVRETESNLANARRKLYRNDPCKNSLSPLEFYRHSEQTASSYQPSTSSFVNNNDHINAIRRQMGWSLPSTSQPTSTVAGTSCHVPLSDELRDLQTKINTQNKMIENLEQLVKTLNHDKAQYCRQIRDLQDEVDSISMRMSENRSLDPVLKSQVDLMRQEVRSDVQRLQNAVSASKPPTLYSNSLERSFQDMQRNVHTELEELRSDLNSMIHRVGRLERDVSTHNTSQRDLKNRLDQSGGSTGSIGRLGHTSSYLSKLTAPLTSGDVFQMRELRSTVSHLHDKLDSLEGHVAASRSSPPTQFSVPGNKFQGTSSKSFKSDVRVNFNDFIDDNDDDDDSDLDDMGLSDELDLDIPDKDDENICDDLDDIGSPRKTTDLNIRTSELGAVFDDDDLSDGLDDDDVGVRNMTGIGSRPSPSRSGKGTQRKKKKNVNFQLPSTSSMGKSSAYQPDVLHSPDHLDLDSSIDPFDLDSLDGMS